MSREDVVERIREDFSETAEAVDNVELEMLENMQFSLAHAIREGSKHSEQEYGWGIGDRACALSAAAASAEARGYM